MSTPDYLTQPDEHLMESVAAGYDDSVGERSEPDVVRRTVEVLAELADGGSAVEFAAGTGRITLPLAAAGVGVHGIDFSEPMLAELRKKPGGQDIPLTVGDMTQTQVCDDASLVYLVFNTITNLRTQELQVQCFRNAAAHLKPGGRFVIEVGVPKLRQVPVGQSIVPFNVSASHLGFEEYIDNVNQISISHHYFIDGDKVRVLSGSFRYVWPSELDLMAQLAGFALENRWADWDRSEFNNDATSHVSVWRLG